ncbi:MAG: class I SAM-dependent methyltransferase [Chitinophagaceae bacterium]
MNTQQAYNTWASQYDTNENKTRDLEGMALRTTLANIDFRDCLEIGCGTGKNTEWLLERARVTGIDLSDEMLAIAKAKFRSDNVQFKQADILSEWTFRDGLYDLVSFSLVLEHIDNLDHVFKQAAASLATGGFVYVGELHPFKQYTGSKARFETENGQHVVECFNHHVSDFIRAAKAPGLTLLDLGEYFDNNDRDGIPRILSLLFKKA